MNETTPKISVIVPMYNAEKYLSTCIKSILNQTFKDFELILIDDCSTDKTLEIAESFDDPRIRILRNEKNLGSPSYARNTGLDAVRGEYIFWVDADDAILRNTLETLLTSLEASDADMIYSNSWLIPNDPEFTDLEGLVGKTQSTSSAPVSNNLATRIWEELCHNHMHSVCWLCLYRKEIFNGGEKIRFPNYLAEDVFVHFDILCKTDKILKIEKPFYIYRVHEASITHSKKNISFAIESTFALTEHIRKKLTPLINDEKFINLVCLSLINGVSSIFFLPAFREDGTKTFHEIETLFKKKFGDSGTNLAEIFYAYLWGQNESIKASELKKALQALLDAK